MFNTHTLSFDKELLTNKQFEVLSVTESNYDANWYSVMHYHDFTEIFYCISGEGFIQTKYGMQAIQKHTLLIVNPFIEHTEHSDIHNPLHYLVIGVKGPEIIFPTKWVENDLFLFQDKEASFFPYIQIILNQIQSPTRYSDPIIEHVINGLLLALSNNANSEFQEIRQRDLSSSVFLAKSHIDNNYSRPISLEDLEFKSHISKYHLSHLFKEELGMSPIQYLQEVRFQNAVVLLTTTNHSITQISDMVGYKSNHYFSRKFREKYQTTPNAYRKIHRLSLEHH